ncbi:hypothetical protein PSCICF_46570 [Pseudomonas cichorii]|nr:SMI1/KNR4 family protein [Pseudomonas cichorii]GFM58479.1 hypothetical protein PSCICF_46570 [Pseudomonas cichorii]GFM63873.1 hypothetical protein PSCICG_50330 [Pseudomonas cichorii]
MINDLGELVAYSEQMALKFPTIAAEIRLCKPGISNRALVHLIEGVPYLPESYLSVIREVRIFGVSIGRLNLWPVSFDKDDLVMSLIEVNGSVSNPWLDFYNANSVVEVARIGANIICLGRKFGGDEGGVYFFDVSSGPAVALKKVADSFEQLLVVAGNMHDVVMSCEGRENNGRKELMSRLRRIGVDDELFGVWSSLLGEELI